MVISTLEIWCCKLRQYLTYKKFIKNSSLKEKILIEICSDVIWLSKIFGISVIANYFQLPQIFTIDYIIKRIFLFLNNLCT